MGIYGQDMSGLEKNEFDLFLTKVIHFRDEAITPRVLEWENNRVFPRSVLTQAATELGLLGMEIETRSGGLGLTFEQKLRVLDKISETSMPFAFSLVNTHNVAARIARQGSDKHRELFLDDLIMGVRFGSTALTEPSAGSDFGAIKTLATRTKGGWLLSGEKAWITNAAASDVIIIYAQTEQDAGARGIASFLIDGTQQGFSRTEPFPLIGGHAIGTGGFRLDNYFCPDGDTLAPAGEGFLAALSSINEARTYVASMCCSMVRFALRKAVTYASTRKTFGHTLLEHQGIAWSLANVANQLEAASLLTEKAVSTISSGKSKEAILAASHAKKFTSEMIEPALVACIQSMGAEGLREEHLLGHHMSAARIANYVDGSTEIQTERISKSLLQSYGN